MKIIGNPQDNEYLHHTSMTIIEFNEGEQILFSYGKPMAVSFGAGECYVRIEEPESRAREHSKNVNRWLIRYHDIDIDDLISDDVVEATGIQGIHKEDLNALVECIAIDKGEFVDWVEANRKMRQIDKEVSIDDPTPTDMVS
jgi:hypothetical protein|tara:strand:- start:1090 stop:1515 length:426 start_codon:yes stop_codon:yes gene_type:complete